MKIVFVFLLCTFGLHTYAQTPDPWNEFAKTKFEPKYNEKLGEYIFHPTFTKGVLDLVGKQVTLEGYYVPFAPEDGNYIVISKFPMSQCFFCGGAGPESIAEVYFTGALPRLKVDDLITVKGQLKLNESDPEHVNFILINAVLITD